MNNNLPVLLRGTYLKQLSPGQARQRLQIGKRKQKLQTAFGRTKLESSGFPAFINAFINSDDLDDTGHYLHGSTTPN